MRKLSLVLSCLFILLCLSGCTSSEHEHTYGPDYLCTECEETLSYSEGLEYELSEAEQTYTVKGIGSAIDTDLVIPPYYLGRPVTDIASGAFRHCDKIVSVSFAGNTHLKEISAGAFEYCTSLTTVIIPENTTVIKEYAFSGCSALSQIQLSKKTTSIYTNAFENCTSLTSITIPESVLGIGKNAFYGCTALTSVFFENTQGWLMRLGGDDYIPLLQLELSDSSIAAKYLTKDYTDYWWGK